MYSSADPARRGIDPTLTEALEDCLRRIQSGPTCRVSLSDAIRRGCAGTRNWLRSIPPFEAPAIIWIHWISGSGCLPSPNTRLPSCKKPAGSENQGWRVVPLKRDCSAATQRLHRTASSGPAGDQLPCRRAETPFSPKSRRAFVARGLPILGMARLMEAAASRNENREQVRVFYDFSEALKWLGL